MNTTVYFIEHKGNKFKFANRGLAEKFCKENGTEQPKEYTFNQDMSRVIEFSTIITPYESEADRMACMAAGYKL